jgi:hypothetical protein
MDLILSFISIPASAQQQEQQKDPNPNSRPDQEPEQFESEKFEWKSLLVKPNQSVDATATPDDAQ